MAHAEVALTALNVLLYHRRWSSCISDSLCGAQVILAFCCLLVLATFLQVVPPREVLESHSSRHPAHFPPNVLHALRFGAPLSHHNTAEQGVYTPPPHILRGLYWKTCVWYSFLHTHHRMELGGLSAGRHYLLTWHPLFCVTRAY